MPNKTVPAIEIPPGLLPAEGKGGAYKVLVSRALRDNLPPVQVETEGVPRVSVFLPPILEAKVQAMADATEDRTFSQIFAGLVVAAISVIEREQAAFAGLPVTDAPFKDPRPEQLRFYQACQKALDHNKICLAEASTGVGKTRAMLAAAIKAAENRATPIVVAAPTLKVLGQLWEELEHLKAEGLGKHLSCSFFPGSGEFVDAGKLRAYIEATRLGMSDAPLDEAVAKWVDDGGPLLSDTPLVRAMNGHAPKLCFLMEDLRTLATNLSPQDFAVDTRDDGSDSLDQLREVREKSFDADIIFCTHTMLGRAHQSQWVLFPQPQVLVIDEAHLFEQNMAAIHTARLSLHALRYRLQGFLRGLGGAKHPGASKAIKEVSRLVLKLKDLDSEELTGGKALRLVPGQHAGLLALTTPLIKALKSKTLAGKDIPFLPQDTAVLTTLESILQGKCSDNGYLEFSPDRRFPGIMAGAADIGKVLGSLWKGTPSGAILASATLYAPDEFGNSKCDYAAKNLAVPKSRIDTPRPVVASWVIKNATMHVPTPEKCKRLARPAAKTRTKEDEAAWLEALGAEIVTVTEKARGGTLVLATSYAQVEAITAALVGRGVEQRRLVPQERGVKFAVTETVFRERHAKGYRPILIGLGAAWTGVNLRDDSVPPSQDTLATDLVIACLPVGLNQTSTMRSRTEITGTHPVAQEALMMLRQGLGRIVRDKGMKDRHIWFMDGRIWNAWQGMRSFCLSVRRILEQYPEGDPF
jgi:ATP-dependent DNA helicase DinG